MKNFERLTDGEMSEILSYINLNKIRAVDKGEAYNVALTCGSVLKLNGYPFSLFDSWVSNCYVFDDEQPKEKWESFTHCETNIGYIVNRAKEQGYKPRTYSNYGSVSMPQQPQIQQEVQPSYKLNNLTIDKSIKFEYKVETKSRIKNLIKFLKEVYREDELVHIVTDCKENNGKFEPIQKNDCILINDLVDKLAKNKWKPQTNKQAGAWIGVNPLDGNGLKKENVTSYRHVLIECDEVSLDEQLQLYNALCLPISTITYSGSKSLHALVKVNAANYEEYKERVEFIYNVCEQNGLKLDKANKNPNRLTRLPSFTRGDKVQIFYAYDMGAVDFKSWENWILQKLKEQEVPNKKEDSLLSALVSMDEVEERETEWLIPNFMPKGKIIFLSGDGGVGKGHITIDLMSAISSGTATFFEDLNLFHFQHREPQKVLYLSSEDDLETTIKKRLGNYPNANTRNIISLSYTSELFANIKYDSEELATIIEELRPALCIFDPFDSFIDDRVNLSQRNVVRQVLNHLVILGEKFGTTFLIVSHTNKSDKKSGRGRIADSAVLFDIARAVYIVGMANEAEKLRYMSNEKQNLGEDQDTILFKIFDGVCTQVSTTKLKDSYFTTHSEYIQQGQTKRGNAKDEIINILLDADENTLTSSELTQAIKEAGYSQATFENARKELVEANRLRIVRNVKQLDGRKATIYKLLDKE